MQALPIDEHLAVEYDEMMLYKSKAEQFNMSRVDFIHQMQTTGEEVDEKRAERMWNSFQSQLLSGSVTINENGTIAFYLPVTHNLAPYMPEVVADLIEATHRLSRDAYVRSVPHRYRRRLEARVEWATESGAMHAALIGLECLLILDISWSNWRSSSGAQVEAKDAANHEESGMDRAP